MALPSNVDHGTVVGYFEDALGNALAGTIYFTPQFSNARDTTSTPKTIILPSQATATLTQGAFSVVLVATDDPDLNLTTWNYLVTPKFTGPNAPTMAPFNIAVPMNTTTDLADAAPVGSVSGVQITKGDPGVGVPTGGTTGQTLVKVSNTDFDTSWATPSSGGTTLTSYDQVSSLSDYPTTFPPDLTSVTPSDIGAEPAGDYATNTALTSGLAGKAPTVHTHTSSQVTDFTTAVDARVQNIVGAAPAALDTLAELATALGDDANFAGTVTTELAGKVPTTRTVAGKPLSADITLAASDVGAVPTTRTVNGKALSANVTLASSDVGAVPTTRQIAGLDLSADRTAAALWAALGIVPIAQATIGVTITVLSTAGGWPARLTTRTDVFVIWLDMNSLGTQPSDALNGDRVIAAS